MFSRHPQSHRRKKHRQPTSEKTGSRDPGKSLFVLSLFVTSVVFLIVTGTLIMDAPLDSATGIFLLCVWMIAALGLVLTRTAARRALVSQRDR